MKKTFCIVLLALLILFLLPGCAKQKAYAPPEGQGWLEGWLKEEEALAQSMTYQELAETCDWVVKTEILEISPPKERTIRLPNGEVWTETYREYTLEIRASFPKQETGRLYLRGASSYTGETGSRLTTPWRQTEWDGLTLKDGQVLWLYGSERALASAPFGGFPRDGLILVVDERDRLLPCREISRLDQAE